jgi:carboxymethylenebutenolidase
MPEYLPFPYALPDGKEPASGKKFEYRVPAAGADTAKKILDKNSVPSNEMFDFKVREIDA